MPSAALIDTRYWEGMKTAVSKYSTPEKANINNGMLSCKIGRANQTNILSKIYNYFLFQKINK